MMELISREDLETIVVDYWGKSNITEWFLKEINSLSSVDWCSKCEMPERAKGKWVLKDGHLQCSNCNEYSDDNDMYPYCRWCGAKMEK